MSGNDFTIIGFDYGIKPFFMLIADMAFSDLFTEANCIGVAYAFTKGDSETDLIPAKMLFMFQKEKPAEKFMDNLLGWISNSNSEGDAVSIEFIENKDDGYTIGISPELIRFHNRMIPKALKNKVTPFFMIQTHYKKIDALSENYLNFKKNYSKANGIDVGYVIVNGSSIKKESKKYFTKREFQFSKEGSDPDSLNALIYDAVKEKSTFNPNNFPEPPKQSIIEIEERRGSEMKSLLPLTWNRLNNQWLGELQKKLSETYALEIIRQAICNLTIFERLKKMDDLSPDFTKKGYANRIQDYLNETFESFDSFYPSDEFYTEELIASQIKNDQKELENYLNK